MSIEFDMPKDKSSIIKVIGVGGAGSNAVNHMYAKGIKGVNFIVANTDEQHLSMSPVMTKILLGPELTAGQGTGSDPEKGKLATEESILAVKEELSHNTKMLFIAAGMGKGTGTGGSPVIARLAKEMGILTVAIITTPFTNMGKQPIIKAESGINNLKEHVDAYIIISNDKILEIYNDLAGREAFAMADDILCNAAKGIAEIITGAGIHNTDFNDVRTVLKDGGKTIMGIGYAKGPGRAIEAVNNALKSPLLSDCDIRGAQKALVNISYSEDHECKMSEIGQIIDAVNEAANADIEIMFGSAIDNTLEDEIAVTIVVTGFENQTTTQPMQIVTKQELAPEPIAEETVIHIDEPIAPVRNENLIEIENTEKEIIINFGTPHVNEIQFVNQSEHEEETNETNVHVQETSGLLFDELGRVVGESDVDKRRRMMLNMSFDVNSPINSSDHQELDLPRLVDHRSNMLITGDDFSQFKTDNRTDTTLC